MTTNEYIRILRNIAKINKEFPAEIAAIAENFSKERFVQQNWLDKSPEPWKPLKRRRKKKNQHILVYTGRLKKSVHKIKVSDKQIIIGSDVPYAQIHNDGGNINATVSVKSHTRNPHTRRTHTRLRNGRKEVIKEHTVREYVVKKHSRKMNITIPQRQFLGNSYTLEQRIMNHIINRFTNAFKK